LLLANREEEGGKRALVSVQPMYCKIIFFLKELQIYGLKKV
jgi:hypothetical protein